MAAEPYPRQETAASAGLVAAATAVRVAFGVVWAIDAYLKWQPGFAAHYLGYLQNAANGQPAWLHPWFAFWLATVTPNLNLFITATRVIETVIALGLLLGFARKWLYVLGASTAC